MKCLRLYCCIIVILQALALSGCVSNHEHRLHTSFSHRYRPVPPAETGPAGKGNPPAAWPVEPTLCRVSSIFGESRPANGGGTRPHGGIDLAALKGTPVFATANGVVIYAGKDGNYGKIVRIAHPGGIQTWYAHLKTIKTKEGKEVSSGQCIGRVGDTGNATGPHLHYEIRIKNKPVNPAKYMMKM